MNLPPTENEVLERMGRAQEAVCPYCGKRSGAYVEHGSTIVPCKRCKGVYCVSRIGLKPPRGVQHPASSSQEKDEENDGLHGSKARVSEPAPSQNAPQRL
ncbi:MAG: hypothetical protein A2992_06485 [Elusimicrobia bacterium RIFCSPLOWO2_01_FULL_59_12]|nr:MAG: hypothetical protein A2992_06485 [Elusimicrobia bacterium RIFCSPLOWO2_01_FULL_59_12]